MQRALTIYIINITDAKIKIKKRKSNEARFKAPRGLGKFTFGRTKRILPVNRSKIYENLYSSTRNNKRKAPVHQSMNQ